MNSDEQFLKGYEAMISKTIKDYDLLEDGQKVLVAVSGGKDSTTALYVLKKLGYDVEGIIIDQLLGEHSKKNLNNIVEFCSQKNIKLHIVHMRDEYGCSVCYMKSLLDERGKKYNTCTICGVIRRDILNRKAKMLGATRLATGHNLDDEAQTFMMNFILGNIGGTARAGPVSGTKRDPAFVQRIKPLYFCSEKDTTKYSQIRGFPVVYEPCPCSKESFRTHVKKILDEIEGKNPNAKENIVSNFLKLTPYYANECADAKLNKCRICFEPTSNEICRKCVILSEVSGQKCGI